MGKITKFDATNLKALRGAINEALAKVAEAHGVVLEFHNITFDNEKFSTKLVGTCGGHDAYAVDYKNAAELYGAKQEWLGKTFVYGKQTFKLIGLMPRATAKPFLVEKADGTKAKCPTEMVLAGFK
jgi:hypothetical protein